MAGLFLTCGLAATRVCQRLSCFQSSHLRQLMSTEKDFPLALDLNGRGSKHGGMHNILYIVIRRCTLQL